MIMDPKTLCMKPSGNEQLRRFRVAPKQRPLTWRSHGLRPTANFSDSEVQDGLGNPK